MFFLSSSGVPARPKNHSEKNSVETHIFIVLLRSSEVSSVIQVAVRYEKRAWMRGVICSWLNKSVAICSNTIHVVTTGRTPGVGPAPGSINAPCAISFPYWERCFSMPLVIS